MKYISSNSIISFSKEIEKNAAVMSAIKSAVKFARPRFKRFSQRAYNQFKQSDTFRHFGEKVHKIKSQFKAKDPMKSVTYKNVRYPNFKVVDSQRTGQLFSDKQRKSIMGGLTTAGTVAGMAGAASLYGGYKYRNPTFE